MRRRPVVVPSGLMSSRERIWVLPVILFSAVGVYAAGVTFRGAGNFSPLVDGVLGTLTALLPATAAWFVFGGGKGREPQILLAACALTSQAASDMYFLIASANGGDVPFPSPADVGYVGFYVLMLGALYAAVRQQLREVTWPVALDSVVGSLGAASFLAIVLDPVVQSAFDGKHALEAALGVAYPLLDLVLVVAVIGISAAAGKEAGSGWLLLVLGLLTFTGADIAYALLELHDLYVVGTPLDAAWALGSALIASWAAVESRSTVPEAATAVKVPVQAVPALATAAGLGVLVFATQRPVMVMAVVLATLTLALAALPMIFRQRLRLMDARRQARTDDLTSLPNRRALYEEVPRLLAAASRRPGALLILDLDKFKEINDGLGYGVGDLLLQKVASRLVGELGPGDLLARIAGDEFVLHADGRTPLEATAMARHLREVLGVPFDLAGIRTEVNASVGIALHPEQGTDLDVLLRKAGTAAATAKSTHSGYVVYAEGGDPDDSARFHTLQDLNRALNNDQLILHYQPQIDLRSGEVRGAEALVRWVHPDLGLLQPDSFLSRFDAAGLMPALTRVVLEKALDQAASWAPREQPLCVAVNLSAGSIMDSGLPDHVLAMTAARGLSPSALVVEITEDVLVVDRQRAYTVLSALRDMGVRIAVDDFGTGYSSLSYLRELPIDELKLDKSFVLNMSVDERATALVVSTIGLAHSLGLEMTAEGVEDAEALLALTEYGCDVVQGYFVSRPLPAGAMEEWLTERAAIREPRRDA